MLEKKKCKKIAGPLVPMLYLFIIPKTDLNEKKLISIACKKICG